MVLEAMSNGLGSKGEAGPSSEAARLGCIKRNRRLIASTGLLRLPSPTVGLL